MKNSKAVLEFNLVKLDKTNPIDFRRKNNFFYENAHLIIDCNPLVSSNCYLDVLQTVKSSNKRTSMTAGMKSEVEGSPVRNKKESSKSNLMELKKIKKIPLQGSSKDNPCPIKLELKPFPIMTNSPKYSANQNMSFTDGKTPSSRNKNQLFKNFTSATQGEDTNQIFKEVSISPIRLKGDKFLFGAQSNTNTITPFIKSKTNIVKFAKVSKFTLKLNKTTKNFSSLRNRTQAFKLDECSGDNCVKSEKSDKQDKMDNLEKIERLEKLNKTDKYFSFDKNEARMMKTLGLFSEFSRSDYCNAQNTYYTCDTYEKTISDDDTSNQRLLMELAKVKCQMFVREKLKNGAKIDNETIKLINTTLKNNNLDAYDYNLISQTIDPKRIGRDHVLDRLETLEKLHTKLPDFKGSIEKLKMATANLEKRKIILGYEKDSMNEKLDNLIGRRDPQLKLNKLNMKNIQRVTFQTLKFKDKNSNKAKLSSQDRFNTNLKKNNSANEEKPIKAKFKKYGECKVMVIPKILISSARVYNNQEMIKAIVQNNANELIDDQLTNIKHKKYFETISSPKSRPSPKCFNSQICDDLRAKCDKLETNNLRLRNKIKYTKRKFNKESLYLNPKSAFIVPN
jgi:hypothetical protein